MIKYQVTANSLNVREEPKLTAKVIGHLSLDEIVEGVSVSGDGYWYKIRREDGLEGWSSHKFLVGYEGEIEGEEFPWMPIALRELGVKEYAGAADNPRIVEYLSSTNLLVTGLMTKLPGVLPLSTGALRKRGMRVRTLPGPSLG
jgi:hypothetical protein